MAHSSYQSIISLFIRLAHKDRRPIDVDWKAAGDLTVLNSVGTQVPYRTKYGKIYRMYVIDYRMIHRYIDQ